jgi:hypothetical protein
MRKFAALVTLGLVVWLTPAWAIVGETTIKVADGAAAVPEATVVVTFKNQAGTPISTVRRTTRRASATKVTIPDNTATVDIAVTTANGQTRTRAGIDVALLNNKEFTIDVPGGSSLPPSNTRGPRTAMPPSVADPTGPIVGLGAGGQTTACDNWETKIIESLGALDPIGDGPKACFSSAFR